jgi:hypothetical protein
VQRADAFEGDGDFFDGGGTGRRGDGGGKHPGTSGSNFRIDDSGGVRFHGAA